MNAETKTEDTMETSTAINSFSSTYFTGLALDPIHVGTGGSRLGRVDNTIVRDPVTRIPKIPGSSLAGVMRAYAAMKYDKYPDCAGQGGGESEHCGQQNCEVCTVFGFAKGQNGGFAGLASFSDMHVLLFPVASRLGPQWITSPMALRQAGIECGSFIKEEAIFITEKNNPDISVGDYLNLGWLNLPVKKLENVIKNCDDGISFLSFKNEKTVLNDYIKNHLCIVSDKLFTHIVNSNLEVRTSVAIDPSTGSAEEGALYTYEALPRGTVLTWELTCRNPKHFEINKQPISLQDDSAIKEIVTESHPYLEHLGIGGMGSRGMGRLRVFEEANNNNGGN